MVLGSDVQRLERSLEAYRFSFEGLDASGFGV